MRPKLSIIIPVFNKVNFTINVLNSLMLLDTNDFEIIVIDNASADTTRQILQEINQKNFKFIFNNENKFHSGACNQGYSIATGERILFLNNDIKIQNQNWAQQFIDAADRTPSYLVGVSGGLVNTKKEFEFVYETQDPSKSINYISGWCFGGAKSFLDKFVESKSVAPLDNQFPLYYNDTDLSFRVIAAHYNLALVSLPITHIGKISTSQFNISKLYTEGKQTFIKKWKDKINDIIQ